MKFKIGDKVRRIQNSYICSPGGMGTPKFGEIYTVSRADTNSTYIGLKEFNDSHSFNIAIFELEKEITELEELIEIANKGENAQRKIKKEFVGQVEHTLYNRDNWNTYNTQCDYEFRIKQKPKFIPFIIEHGEVDVKGESLHIGCQIFDLKYSKIILLNLFKLNKNYHHVEGSSNVYYATKNGIKNNDNLLKWADAEKIYEAIKDL